jgi:hypothetical protein
MVVNGVAWDVAASQVYSDCALWLQVSQTAALMEIVHAAIGFVRSPVMITAMQVMSRIVALVAVVYAPTAQGTFKVFLLPSTPKMVQILSDNHHTYISMILTIKNAVIMPVLDAKLMHIRVLSFSRITQNNGEQPS